RERSYPIDVNAGPTKVDPHIAAIGPTQLRKGLRERRDAKLRRRIVFVEPEHADAPHSLGLLRPRRERPRSRTAEQHDELAPVHWITASARASKVEGTSRPSALAVFKLIASWYWVGCWTGRSAGFSPLRTRST